LPEPGQIIRCLCMQSEHESTAGTLRRFAIRAARSSPVKSMILTNGACRSNHKRASRRRTSSGCPIGKVGSASVNVQMEPVLQWQQTRPAWYDRAEVLALCASSVGAQLLKLLSEPALREFCTFEVLERPSEKRRHLPLS
jgi:hypothetical protein